MIAVSSYSCIVDSRCFATKVHGASLKLESLVLGWRSICTLYTFLGTFSMSLIASAVVKFTCPDTRTGNLDVGGRLEPVSCCRVGKGGGGGGSAIAVVGREGLVGFRTGATVFF